MNRWKRSVARAMSEVSAACRRGPQSGLRILMYHAIGSCVASDSYGFSVSQDRFASQLRLLQERADLEVVGLAEGAEVSERLRVAVTFDDGFKDTLTVAAPLMIQSHIPWTVFVTTAFLGSSPDYLTTRELRELAALPGAHIGAHGLTHVPLTGCSETQLYQELRDSRQKLEDILGRPITALAYPHGAVDQRVRQVAAACGYRLGASSRSGINDKACDPLLLCRTEIVGADSLRVFAQKLEGAWDWMRWRSPDPAISLNG